MFRKTFVSLWLLLAIAFAIVCVAAFSDDISLGRHKLKKAPIADLFKEHEQELDSLLSLPDTVTFASDSILTDSLPQSIFIFGDSMTFNLALRLAQYAKQNGHTIHSVNWDSSNTKIWAESDTLNYFMKKFKPTQVFIALGSNELYVSKPETRLPYIKKILEKIDSVPYVWIGPPNWKEDKGINDLLAKICKPGTFFKSAGMEFKRKSDNIHPTRASSALWIDSIMRWIPSSSHPFLADTPSDSIGKVNPNIVFLKALNK